MTQQQETSSNNKKVLDKLLSKEEVEEASVIPKTKSSFASKILKTLEDEIEEKKTAYTFYVKPSTINGLGKIARKLGKSRSAVIQEVLETALEELQAAK
ncbi:MAG: hypothetical protein AB8B66_01515 [Rickettsiaceae bacterium]